MNEWRTTGGCVAVLSVVSGVMGNCSAVGCADGFSIQSSKKGFLAVQVGFPFADHRLHIIRVPLALLKG
jgi:hypothetical protein